MICLSACGDGRLSESNSGERGGGFGVSSRAMGRTLASMDIHSPTVAQQPLGEAAGDLNDLLDEKIVLEETLGRFAEILETHGVGMHDKLPWSLTNVRHVHTVG